MAFSLNDYSNLERIGSGGMGNVYSAIQRSLGRKVAIKEMALIHKNDPALVQCFENEARFAASLDHANVIRIYDFGEDNNSFFIAMEYIDGYSFEQILSWNPLPKQIGLLVVLQALKGLQYAHSRKIAHCDIKPNNILVSRTGRVVVTDFGIANASAQAAGRSATKKMLITPAFLPPEQAVNVQEQVMSRDSTIDTIPVFVSEAASAQIPDLDFRRDIWAVGVLLYRTIAGKLPFSGPTTMATVMAIQRGAQPPIASFFPTLPDTLSNHIDACLIKEPRKRLSSLDPLIGELQELMFDYGFRDSEQEIRRFLADNVAYSEAIEKDLIDYHVRKGNEFKASGNAEKSKLHFEAAKQIVFDPAKKDKPIDLFPGLSTKRLPTHKSTHGERASTFATIAATAGNYITPKRIKMAAITAMILMALAFGVSLIVTVVERAMTSASMHQRAAPKKPFRPPAQERAATAPVERPAPQVAANDTVPVSTPIKTDPPAVSSPQHLPQLTLVEKTREMRKAAQSTTMPDLTKRPAIRRKGPTPSGTLFVTVNPPSAYVFIDEAGIPRQELSAGKILPTGPHIVSAVADGYLSHKEAIMILEDSTVTLNITLKRAAAGSGFLHVYCYPWAELYIDGSYQGQAPTPNPLPLKEGTHSLRLRREGFKTYIENVTIAAGEEKRIQIEMEPE